MQDRIVIKQAMLYHANIADFTNKHLRYQGTYVMSFNLGGDLLLKGVCLAAIFG